MRLPSAPPQTSPSDAVRHRSPGRVLRYRRPRMPSAITVSPMNTQRDCGPTCRPNAAPGLYTSVSLSQSPATEWGSRCGTRPACAHHLLETSMAVIASETDQNATVLLLRIILARLA